ncbi:MAG: glycoside hydrolase family 9 protein, partial [Polyangiaceae bacterium]
TFAGGDVVELLRAYAENPAAFTDDTGIPESGNGVPDVLDETKWELDWLSRMQRPDGSVLSVASHAGASPPSSDASPCRYGPASTASTLAAAAAFAEGSSVLASVGAVGRVYPGFASGLAGRAQAAWKWAVANPAVAFSNTAVKLAGGEQDLAGNERAAKRLQAAVFLFGLTGGAEYRSAIDAEHPLLQAAFDPFHLEAIETALEYARLPGATPTVAREIDEHFKASVEGPRYFGALATPASDPYLAYLQAYVWGSNQSKADQGNMFADVVTFGIDPSAGAAPTDYAARYVHYLHGVNPLGLAYLTNMSGSGAERSVTRMFHSWFAHGSQWDFVGGTSAGPPPGFLTGGPNPGYAWDRCCPSSCGVFNDSACGAAPPAPPSGQPPQKSYKDFNEGWPLDSWSVTEPDLAYQARYVRLLSKFVR